ncbi:MAG: hypothetical protein COU22_01115 [Candidatus Komeilibacteria bacterium CG10_big_fil_rev_8_21_14_0_10_41_13]|uniref:Methyltransferase type 11 domain-containing protein n=1 Tax=Candidatus Komeilibacteria bacterium CG10_big_fil_rev_8_21_14_0_10_41_13 TaxID=1974476 RepID=A0A2M6WCX2_9BACT|nr:MAG: hypothetical protein COU22_01115 [Candidatus Komeilibacteria bacterium CG10_big_fil_rev_8_21_14_0_10_41_13]
MTVWDNIYKDYEQGGQAWATLSEDIDPLFRQFLEEASFSVKKALDIGCGTGKYLKLLQSLGFKTDGLDSSQTAVKMTKELLGDQSDIQVANMFELELPANEYDLILSVSTIHHGLKSQIEELVGKIYQSLVSGGYIFITLPDFSSSKKWNTFKDHEQLAEATFAPLTGPEKGLPHSFYEKPEIENLFSDFNDLQLNLDGIGRWFIRGGVKK